MPWSELAEESLAAAGELLRSGRYRSSVSRSYFAAFARAVSELAATKTTFPANWDGPTHRKLPELVELRLLHLQPHQRRDVKSLIRTLYNARIGADYRPAKRFEYRDASEALKQATLVLRRLEVKR